jgi:hypothetical protein
MLIVDPWDDPEFEDYVVALANAAVRSPDIGASFASSPLRRGSC